MGYALAKALPGCYALRPVHHAVQGLGLAMATLTILFERNDKPTGLIFGSSLELQPMLLLWFP